MREVGGAEVFYAKGALNLFTFYFNLPPLPFPLLTGGNA
jgi:hypothetical protein